MVIFLVIFFSFSIVNTPATARLHRVVSNSKNTIQLPFDLTLTPILVGRLFRGKKYTAVFSSFTQGKINETQIRDSRIANIPYRNME